MGGYTRYEKVKKISDFLLCNVFIFDYRELDWWYYFVHTTILLCFIVFLIEFSRSSWLMLIQQEYNSY